MAGGKAATVRKILTRGVVLFLIGLFYSGGLKTPLARSSGARVLNRIALCYTAAALLFVFLKSPDRCILALLLRILGADGPGAHPGYSTGNLPKAAGAFEQTTQRVSWALREPGYNRQPWPIWPPAWTTLTGMTEGILSTLPAIGSCLLGLFRGSLAAAKAARSSRRSLGSLRSGGLPFSSGIFGRWSFPIVKNFGRLPSFSWLGVQPNFDGRVSSGGRRLGTENVVPAVYCGLDRTLTILPGGADPGLSEGG